MTCGADCRYQHFRRLLPSVFRVEWRMVNYAVMAVEQKICSNMAWYRVQKDINLLPLLSHYVSARSSAFEQCSCKHTVTCLHMHKTHKSIN